MLAEGGDDGEKEGQAPLGQSDTDEEEDVCHVGVETRGPAGESSPWSSFQRRSSRRSSRASAEGYTRQEDPDPKPSTSKEDASRKPSKRKEDSVRKSSKGKDDPDPKPSTGEEDPDPKPSTSAAASGDVGEPASSQSTAGQRVEHKTSLNLGSMDSPHYEQTKGQYGFPRLGEGSSHLRKVLKNVQDTAKGLCFLHTDLHEGKLHADYRLSNGIWVTVNIHITEISKKNHSPLHMIANAFTAGSHPKDHRHFGLDVVCLLEEMILGVLDEAEKTGMANGETSILYFEVTKPQSVPCTGKVMLEVSATKTSDSGLKDDDWVEQ